MPIANKVSAHEYLGEIAQFFLCHCCFFVGIVCTDSVHSIRQNITETGGSLVIQKYMGKRINNYVSICLISCLQNTYIIHFC